DLQARVAIKNQTMADLQDNASNLADPLPESSPEEIPRADASPAVETPAVPAQAAEVEPAQPEKTVKKPVAPSSNPVSEPSLTDGLADNPMLLAIAGGILLLLGGGWFYLRNRRKHNLDSFEQGILTAGGLKANTVFGNT